MVQNIGRISNVNGLNVEYLLCVQTDVCLCRRNAISAVPNGDIRDVANDGRLFLSALLSFLQSCPYLANLPEGINGNPALV